MNENAEELAFGRWPDILTARGMDPSYFSGKSGPCPFCGGKDRYRWVQKKHGGVWMCNQCTVDKYGTGFAMLMRHMGYQLFRDAANDVREFFSSNTSIKPVPLAARAAMSNEWTPERIERNRARMLKFWNEARQVTAGDPVDQYMQRRVPGMHLQLRNLRYHPALEYWAPPPEGHDKPVLLGKFAAMLAAAQGADGQLVQLHKTYLTQDGRKADVPLAKKTDLGVNVNSFAVRMMDISGDTLGVCEGLETGWASAMLKSIPIWPCLNGPAMSSFVLPEELRGQIKRLIIFADSDELKQGGRNADGTVRMSRPGSVYAEKLAQNARQQQGLRTLIIRPATVGDDIADYWNKSIAA
jgi:putative DNA primase/helicase